MGATRRLSVLIAVIGLVAAAHAQAPRLAVMDLRAGEGMTPAQARTLTGMLRTALHQTAAFTLINREGMEEIAQNHQIELVFCDEDACLLKVGSLLGAQKLVAGELVRTIRHKVRVRIEGPALGLVLFFTPGQKLALGLRVDGIADNSVWDDWNASSVGSV